MCHITEIIDTTHIETNLFRGKKVWESLYTFILNLSFKHGPDCSQLAFALLRLGIPLHPEAAIMPSTTGFPQDQFSAMNWDVSLVLDGWR